VISPALDVHGILDSVLGFRAGDTIMTIRSAALPLGVICLAAGIAYGASSDDLTTPVTGRGAFDQPFPFLRGQALTRFREGDEIFDQTFAVGTSEDPVRFSGVGPLWNQPSCAGCHAGDGRGEPSKGETDPMRSSLVRLSVPGKTPQGGPLPEPTYGDQFQPFGAPGVPGEGEAGIRWTETERVLDDGMHISLRRPELVLRELHYGPMPNAIMTSIRMAPAGFGLGLLESVPEAELLALADPNDKNHDGIRGRLNHVWDFTAGRTTIGRFGLKANQPNLRQQVAGALNGDMGVTSRVFAKQNCTAAEKECLNAPAPGTPEISDADFATLVSYVKAIAPPAPRPFSADARAGELWFKRIGCASCHVPTLTTGDNPEFPRAAHRTIHPYTDLLLHDMGEGLADGRPDYEASGRDWRTTPLWGIGLVGAVSQRAFYLHDGRARSLTEAILWHGGEAQSSRDAFSTLTDENRQAIIEFLNTL
jgi:CxxC motif-containing protein (DUF1111 family)